MPELPLPEELGTTPLDFGPYTSVVADDTTYWNMGGNGLVPYGAPQPGVERAPDLIDAIQSSRPAHCRRVVTTESVIVAPGEAANESKQEDDSDPDRSSHRRIKPAEPIPPGEASEEGEEPSPDQSSLRRTRPAQTRQVSGKSKASPAATRTLTLPD